MSVCVCTLVSHVQATGLPGCTVTTDAFTACWINYANGCIAVGTGPVGSSLSYIWHDPEPAIADIQHVGLSCWDKHISYRNVQLLPALPQQLLQELRADLQRKLAAQPPQRQPSAHLQPSDAQQGQQQQHQQQGESGARPHDQQAAQATDKGACTSAHALLQDAQEQGPSMGCCVPPLLQLIQHALVSHLQPADVCHMLQLSEALLPRTQHLYDEAVQLAGEWFSLLAQQHLQELAMLPLDVLMDVVHEPLLVSLAGLGQGRTRGSVALGLLKPPLAGCCACPPSAAALHTVRVLAHLLLLPSGLCRLHASTKDA